MIEYFLLIFVLTFVMQKLYVDKISKLKFFRKEKDVELIKKSCIQELHKQKQSIPTMAGIFINLSFLIFTIIYYIFTSTILWANIALIGFGIVGFIDDFLKIKKKKDGITSKQKMIGLIAVSVILICILILKFNIGGISLSLAIPFIESTLSCNKICFILLALFILIASTNSLNLTDGLDGLALGISTISLIFVMLIAFKTGRYEIVYGVLTLIASCLATLCFNFYPAKVFMGDTGSLFLGGVIAYYFIELNIPFHLILVFGMCIFDTVSVILQLTSLKLFNKKIFKIAPFHHHLEKCGYSEKRIVLMFWLITLVLTIIAYIDII